MEILQLLEKYLILHNQLDVFEQLLKEDNLVEQYEPFRLRKVPQKAQSNTEKTQLNSQLAVQLNRQSNTPVNSESSADQSGESRPIKSPIKRPIKSRKKLVIPQISFHQEIKVHTESISIPNKLKQLLD